MPMAENADDGLFTSFGKDTLLYVPYRIFPVLFGFIGLWIYTRIFSPADYGVYTLLNITILLLGILAYTWIDDANLRFYQPYKKDGRLRTYFTTTFVLQTLTLVVLFLILLGLWRLALLPWELVDYMLLLAGAMAIFSYFETVLTFLRSERQATEASLYRTLSAFLYLAVSLFFIFAFHLGIASILLSYIVTNLGITIVVMLKHRYLSYIDLRSFSWDTMKEFTGYGLPLIMTEVFYWLLVLSDRYIIEFFRGPHEVGIYSASYQLADYPISLFTSMMLVAALPLIFDMWEKKGEELTKRMLTGLMRYYALFVVPAFAGVALLAPYIMTILTADYASGFVIVPFVCLSKALYGLVWYLNKGMELYKKTMIMALLIAFAGATDIGLNILLVPRLGFLGAAASLAIAYTAYSLLTWAISRRYLRWPMPWASLKNIVAATAVMIIVILAAQRYVAVSLSGLLLLVLIGTAVYGVAILLTGELRSEVQFIAWVASAAGARLRWQVNRALF